MVLGFFWAGFLAQFPISPPSLSTAGKYCMIPPEDTDYKEPGAPAPTLDPATVDENNGVLVEGGTVTITCQGGSSTVITADCEVRGMCGGGSIGGVGLLSLILLLIMMRTNKLVCQIILDYKLVKLFTLGWVCSVEKQKIFGNSGFFFSRIKPNGSWSLTPEDTKCEAVCDNPLSDPASPFKLASTATGNEFSGDTIE